MSLNFTAHDRGSKQWLEIKAYCEGRIEALRKDNDNDKDVIATAKLRGRIESFKEILRAGSPAREVVTDADFDRPLS
jgi:hypothetical protein